MRDDLPTGTVTFLFTDVEGSPKLLHELGAAANADALAELRRVIREACAAESGVGRQGDVVVTKRIEWADDGSTVVPVTTRHRKVQEMHLAETRQSRESGVPYL